MDKTPVSLLERLRDPDDDAWNDLVHAFNPFLLCIARRYGLNPDDAAEVIQEVWLAVVSAMPAFRYNPQRSFRAWLATVFARKLIDRRRRASPTECNLDTLPETAVSGEAFGEDEYRRWLVARALDHLRKNFSPHQETICREYIMNGRPAADVGAALRMSANAVYLAARRISAQMRAYLKGLLE